MRVFKAPEEYPDYIKNTIFLAGSIEMGTAEKWQDKVIDSLKDYDVTFLNPRRDDWDSSWEQSINNPEFVKQVNWELNGLGYCDVIFMYFDPNTKSPISLLELGLFAEKFDFIVVCPEKFYRKGNVEIVCDRYGIDLVDDFEEGIKLLKNKFKNKK